MINRKIFCKSDPKSQSQWFGLGFKTKRSGSVSRPEFLSRLRSGGQNVALGLGMKCLTPWVNRYQKRKTSLDLNEAKDDGVL